MGRRHGGAEVFDFRDELKRQKRQRRSALVKSIAVTVGGGVLVGLAVATTPSVWAAIASSETSPQFSVCGALRDTCVIDGDTLWLDGEKIRIADIDTPEINEPQCDSEYQRGIRARDRLVVLLNAGPFNVSPIGNRDEDQYGRKLRVVTRGGSSLGDQLVTEGLARTWTGRRQPWC